MNENVKLDIAIEIMSTKIAMAMGEKDKELVDKLLDEREKMYSGDWDVINKILTEYSKDVRI